MTKNKNQENQRIRMTRQLFQVALIQLLQEKPIGNITVKELCTNAGLNRSTFYAHYYDVYDLLEEIEDELYEEIAHAMQKYGVQKGVVTSNGIVTIYTEIIDIIVRHYDVFSVMLGPNVRQGFIQRMLTLGKEKCLVEWGILYPHATKRQLETFYAFVAGGCIGLLRFWMENGKLESSYELAVRFENYVQLGAQSLEKK